MMLTPTNSQGYAAELMVCADLCKQGYVAYLPASGLRYDVVVDVSGRLLKIQVKSTGRQRSPSAEHKATYVFQLQGRRKISPHEVDIVALVAVDIGVIAYLPPSECIKNKLQLKAPGTAISSRSKKAYTIDQLPFGKLLEEMTI